MITFGYTGWLWQRSISEENGLAAFSRTRVVKALEERAKAILQGAEWENQPPPMNKPEPQIHRMAQGLRALSVLAEHLGSVSSQDPQHGSQLPVTPPPGLSEP